MALTEPTEAIADVRAVFNYADLHRVEADYGLNLVDLQEAYNLQPIRLEFNFFTKNKRANHLFVGPVVIKEVTELFKGIALQLMKGVLELQKTCLKAVEGLN